VQIRRINPNPKVNSGEVEYRSKIPNTEPNNILEEIVWHKEVEVERMQDRLPLINHLHQKLQEMTSSYNFWSLK